MLNWRSARFPVATAMRMGVVGRHAVMVAWLKVALHPLSRETAVVVLPAPHRDIYRPNLPVVTR